MTPTKRVRGLQQNIKVIQNKINCMNSISDSEAIIDAQSRIKNIRICIKTYQIKN